MTAMSAQQTAAIQAQDASILTSQAQPNAAQTPSALILVAAVYAQGQEHTQIIIAMAQERASDSRLRALQHALQGLHAAEEAAMQQQKHAQTT